MASGHPRDDRLTTNTGSTTRPTPPDLTARRMKTVTSPRRSPVRIARGLGAPVVDPLEQPEVDN